MFFSKKDLYCRGQLNKRVVALVKKLLDKLYCQGTLLNFLSKSDLYCGG